MSSIRMRLLILASLVLLSAYVVAPQTSVRATCYECVSLSGGLCVGCDPNTPAHDSCIPRQETCDCIVMGSCPGGGN